MGPRFHNADSLRNGSGGTVLNADLDGDGVDEVRLPLALGDPYLRDGAGVFPFRLVDTTAARPLGRPREFFHEGSRPLHAVRRRRERPRACGTWSGSGRGAGGRRRSWAVTSRRRRP